MHAIPNEARKYLMPNRQAFAADPFGYSAFACHRWRLAREAAGFPTDLEASASGEELKSPVLWLAHAHALSEAAVALVRSKPRFDSMPDSIKGVCDSQYCAVSLMLVGYSLETCLKGMLIIRNGVQAYSAEEPLHRHHRLEELAAIIPDLGPKEKAILRTLAHFVTWAGRYPDPGSGRENKLDEVFDAAEEHQITAQDVFDLATRVMGFASELVG